MPLWRCRLTDRSESSKRLEGQRLRRLARDTFWGNAMSNDVRVDSDTLAKMLINSYEMVNLMADYASRYGYLLGGLEMIAAGQATAEAVLESYRKKYEQPEPNK